MPYVANVNINPGAVFECIPYSQFGAYINGTSGGMTALGTENNPIIFRGVGYSQFITKGGALKYESINNASSNPINISYVNFDLDDSDSPSIEVTNKYSNNDIIIHDINCTGSSRINLTINSSNSSTNLNNIYFGYNSGYKLNYSNSSGIINLNNINSSNNGNLFFDMDNSSNQINLNNIDFGSIHSLGFQSDQLHYSQLQSINNCNIDNYSFLGLWNINLQNDILIPENGILKLFNKGGDFINDLQFTTSSKIIVNGIAEIKGNFNYNRDLIINPSGLLKIRTYDDPSLSHNYFKINQGYGIICNGRFDADAGNDSVYITVNGSGKWNGIKCLNNKDFTMNNVKVRNAKTGVEMSKPNTNVYIQNSRFSENLNYDIFLDNLHSDFRATRLIKNNIFTGNPNKISSVICNNGLDIKIENNQFDEDYNLGLTLLWMTNPIVKQNVFKASTAPNYSPTGIYSYSSGGFYSCNNITNYLSGIKLDNSSPYIYNNDIYNNGVGLYCENSSNPVLSPSFLQNQTLYIGGYNRIFNNLNEEIYCNNNSFVPLSLPILSYGFNSIYDGNQDCLINIGNINSDVTYSVENNYWGGGSPQGRLCPQNVNYIFLPYLAGEPDPPAQCEPYIESSNNSNMSGATLLFGSANIDDYNGNINSAIAKYKLLVDPVNNIQLSLASISKILYSISKDTTADYYALENYYLYLSNLYPTDTLFSHRASSYSTFSDVEQPAYPEAIDEYQAVINNPLNEVERHYAYIDKLRTIRLMLDSLLNGYDNGPMSYNMNELQLKTTLENILNFKVTNNSQNTLKDDFEKNSNTKNIKNEKLISSITKSDKNNQINKIYKSFNLENINLSVLSNTEKVSLLNNIIAFKLFEFSILNDNHNTRPLDRMNIQRKYSLKTNNLPKVFKLYQNYPNPFNPISRIKYDIPQSSKVLIKIYDLLGREVKTLVNETKEPGTYEAYFNGINLASGVYIYKIEAGTFVESKKMVLIK